MSKRKQVKTPTWSKKDMDRAEAMSAEFVGGGPFDGMRLRLHIVREAPGYIRVLEQGYTAPEKFAEAS